MRKKKNFSSLLLKQIMMICLLAIGLGYWTFSAHAAEKEGAQIKQSFIPCHPRGGDLSPDGKLFVSINPGVPSMNILEIGTEQKQTQISLPRMANDVVMIDASRAVVSFGPWGEIATIDLNKKLVEKPFKVGTTVDGMCKNSARNVLVADPDSNNIYLVDPGSQTIVKTFPIVSKPAQMHWLVPDLQAEVADAEGKVLGTIILPQQSQPQQQKNPQSPKK